MSSNDLNKIGQQMTGGFSGLSIKEKILNGIKTATEKLGVKLVNEEWGTQSMDDHKKWDCACALGCMLVANDLPMDAEDTDFNEATAADFLGVNKEWVEGFIYGFDASEKMSKHPDDAFQLGVELRQTFNVGAKVEEEEEIDDEEDHF